ncbi:MAG: ABC transporter ATP-binding protein [Phycisphaerales bacterium JB038]
MSEHDRVAPRTAGGKAPQPILELRQVHRTFHVGEVDVRVLKGVDMTVGDGEFLCLVGPSGSGKSTVLNLIGGIDRPTSGEVLFQGASLAQLSNKQLTQYRRNTIGFVFQFYNLVPTLTALENVRVATELVDDPLPAAEALSLVGLSERADHFPAQLSGGEQQRIAIARALAKRPTVVLCDEPTGALDAATGKQVLGLIAEINRDLGTTMIVVTHNAPIAQMANRMVRIGSGVIQESIVNETRIAAEEIAW